MYVRRSLITGCVASDTELERIVTSCRAPMGKEVRLGEFAELVVREFLRVKGFSKTLASLNAEKAARTESETLPSAQSWYSVSEEIGLADLLSAHKQVNQEGASSIIEVMTAALMHERSVKMRRPATVSMIRSSPGTSRGDQDVLVYDGSTGELHSTAESPERLCPLRGVPTERSVSTAPSLGGHKSHHKSDNSSLEFGLLERLEKGNQSPKREKRPVTVGGKHRRHHHLHYPTHHGKHPDDPEKPLIRRMYRPVEYEARKAAAERTWSNEKWIPDEVRDRMIMRNLHVLKINVDGQRMYKETIKRRSKWIFVTDLDHNKTQERLGSKHQLRCALCEFKFSEVNMRLAVPYKAIVDLRLLWSNQRPESLGEFSKKKLAVAALLKPPLCYDRVRVCTFCSQFLNDQEAYRPPAELREEEQRRLVRQQQEAEAALWWDPLRVLEEERKRELQADLDMSSNGGAQDGPDVSPSS